jgi:hypothetical protein
MGFEVTTAFVQQYADNIRLMAQQKGSRLRNAVLIVDGVKGKTYYHDAINSTAARKRTSRHADTPLISTPHDRTQVTLNDYDWADLVDDLDKVKMLADPTSPYAINAAYAMGRAMDQSIIDVAVASRAAGEAGGTATAIGSAQQIVNASTGLTVAKLLSSKKVLDKSNDLETKRHITVTANEVADLLNEAEVKSSDYNTVKALAQGQINTYMGYEFHQTELLATASSITTCFGWIENGIVLAIGQDIKYSIDKRPDKNNAMQPYYGMSIGASRTEEKKVVQVDTYHA